MLKGLQRQDKRLFNPYMGDIRLSLLTLPISQEEMKSAVKMLTCLGVQNVFIPGCAFIYSYVLSGRRDMLVIRGKTVEEVRAQHSKLKPLSLSC